MILIRIAAYISFTSLLLSIDAVYSQMSDDSSCPFDNDTIPDFNSYVNAILELSQLDFENVNGTDMDYSDFMTQPISVGNETYELNTTLHYTGSSSSLELIGNATYQCTSIVTGLYLMVDAYVRVPNLLYDIYVQLTGYDEDVIINGIAENMNSDLMLSWSFIQDEEGNFVNSLEAVSTDKFGKSDVILKDDFLSEELMSNVVPVLENIVETASTKVFVPLSDIFSSKYTNVNISDFIY